MNHSGLFLITLHSEKLVSRYTVSEILALMNAAQLSAMQNQISFFVTYERLSIEDARELRLRIMDVVQGDTIIITADRLPEDSQQPLLKVLEELPRQMRCVIIVPPSTTILPTVLSRAIEHLHIDDQPQGGSQEPLTVKAREALHKKDPELYKQTIIREGMNLLKKLTAAKKLDPRIQSRLYTTSLELIEKIPSARSAKMIDDYLANVTRYIQKKG